MFCPRSGYLLDLNANSGVASCSVSGYKQELQDFSNVKVTLKTDMEDYRRRFNLEPLVKGAADVEEMRQRATTDEACPKCGHQGMEYYTMQLRSADEGQTVFYECPECKHKFSVNN
ncbi:hypothetical protein FOA52_010398 [Chlamydomonas sp. UWO 241]|nr:hypothetical protein FOA52_010398 [Chlamydomonas sp. UWO 241]